MTDKRLATFSTGPAPARYVVLSVSSRTVAGEYVAHHLKQQRVHHTLYSAPTRNYVDGMMARLDKAQRGAWGGKC